MTPPPSPQRAAQKPSLSRRSLLAGGLSLLVAAGGSSAWALDRFVVDHVEITDVAAYESSQGVTATAASTVSATVTGTSYTSDTASLTIRTLTSGSRQDTITAYLADLQLTEATALRSAFAQNRFGTNIIENPSTIAQGVGAVFAVNGDYYGFRDTGIIIRNGVIYRDSSARQGLAFYRDGTVKLYDETATTAKQFVAEGVWNTLSFGPGLVENSAVLSGIDDVEVDTNVGNHSIQGQQPRTGLGLVGPDHYLVIVVDGRSPGYSRGVTMTEFAQMFADAGASVAYNLDGGGSSTMYFNGSLVNNPLGKGQERGTSDILYLAG